MIARLAGTLLERSGTHVVIDCNGVGYQATCSAYTLGQLPALGERVALRVFTHASENKVALFAFFDQAERELFDLLITVKNVGPTTASTILSGSTPRDIGTLIAKEDVAGLTRIKGVGKKTAELLVVELREKCELLVLTWNADGQVRAVAHPSAVRAKRAVELDEVAAALVGLGWRPAEADKAVGELEFAPGTKVEDLLRQALRHMSR